MRCSSRGPSEKITSGSWRCEKREAALLASGKPVSGELSHGPCTWTPQRTGSIIGRALSTRCRPWCSRSFSSCPCSWWCSSFCRRKSPVRTRRSRASTQDRATQRTAVAGEARQVELEDQLAQLRAGLANAESERDSSRASPKAPARAARRRPRQRTRPRSKAKSRSPPAHWRRSRCSTSRSRRCAASSQRSKRPSPRPRNDKEAQARIADLGSRLNVALAQRVQELSRFRSDFFGRLREILGNRPDIRIVGDRFVLQSEVFFDVGQALLPTAKPTRQAGERAGSRETDTGRHRLGAAGRWPH